MALRRIVRDLYREIMEEWIARYLTVCRLDEEEKMLRFRQMMQFFEQRARA